jgi:hypothetical protein
MHGTAYPGHEAMRERRAGATLTIDLAAIAANSNAARVRR